jgi:hypothetical protein
MLTTPTDLPCDGCGLPASPEHIAERVRRLELCTQFRPIHLGVLFIALAPPVRAEDDFYSPENSKDFAEPFLETLEIPSTMEKSARLAEFQRRGYYLTYLSECPIPEKREPVAATIERLGPTLIRRIRFNYRPKQIAPMGQELIPLVEMLKAAGIGPILTLEHGLVLPIPRTGLGQWMELFRRSVTAAAP